MLQVIPAVQKPILRYCRLQFDYTQMNEVMRVIKRYNCHVEEQDAGLFIRMRLGVPRSLWEDVTGKFADLQGVEVELT